MKNPIAIAIVSALITAAAIKAAPAIAQDSGATREVSVVRTADLDLSTAKGRSALQHRLANAARQVCGTASDTDLEGKKHVRKCRDETLARAFAQRDDLVASRREEALIAVTAAR